jgi:hypothetical protein
MLDVHLSAAHKLSGQTIAATIVRCGFHLLP